MCQLFRQLVRDERGQDLVEYALLTASLALVSVATWPTVAETIATAYRALDRNTQSLWEAPLPGSGP
jgi:Flp pilus assembly pilin Flp